MADSPGKTGSGAKVPLGRSTWIHRRVLLVILVWLVGVLVWLASRQHAHPGLRVSPTLGEHSPARNTRRELALRQECGDPVGEAYAVHDMAVAEQGLGHHHATIKLGERARGLYSAAAATEQFLADVLETMSVSLEHTGDH